MNSPIKLKHLVLATMTLGAMAASQAQTTATTTTAAMGAATAVQRDVNQQGRIEQGLKSGQLSTREASKLQVEESHVDRLQARDLKDGHLSSAEKVQLTQAQDKVSQDIRADKTNAEKGNPASASSQRLLADTQRNVNQQSRIEQGLNSGSLTPHEAGTLERGQARVSRREARAGADGHISAREQRRIQRTENHQSRRIHRQKHDA